DGEKVGADQRVAHPLQAGGIAAGSGGGSAPSSGAAASTSSAAGSAERVALHTGLGNYTRDSNAVHHAGLDIGWGRRQLEVKRLDASDADRLCLRGNRLYRRKRLTKTQCRSRRPGGREQLSAVHESSLPVRDRLTSRTYRPIAECEDRECCSRVQTW